MLDHLATEAVFASLHNADPGDSGANELAGGSPAYARKAIAWNPAAAGSMHHSNVPVFDVPAGGKVLYVGFWSLASGGVWQGGALVTEENFGGQGTYTLTEATMDQNA
jgi:hypothetical protein